MARRTIIFRLWLAMCLVAIACTTLALGAYVWLTIRGNISDSETKTQAKVQAVALATARLGSESQTPNALELATARSLGIQLIAVYNDQGQLVNSFGVMDGAPPAAPSLDATTLAAANTLGHVTNLVRIEPGAYVRQSISPWDVIRGGHFGEEEVVPLGTFFPGRTDVARVTAAFSDLSAEARSLILLSLAAEAAIVGTLLVSVWLFLYRFVAQPLSQYSRLAFRIAMGEKVRMPVRGEDELSELGRAVNGMADALEHQATVDNLTGLYNLRHLSSNLESLLAESARDAEPLTVIFGDLDNLKPVNDTYGHEAGDAVLRAVGATLRTWAGDDNTCWRLGGDEFVLALPKVSATAALAAADTLCEAVNATLVPIHDTQVRPSISVGIATYPQDGDSAGTLLGIADRRMYTAKAVLHRKERRLSSAPAA